MTNKSQLFRINVTKNNYQNFTSRQQHYLHLRYPAGERPSVKKHPTTFSSFSSSGSAGEWEGLPARCR